MMKELFAGFGTAMVAGILAIYIVLVLLFKDFFQPITILAALPLSLGGAFVGVTVGGAVFLDVIPDRVNHVDGDCDQKLDTAGRLCDRVTSRPHRSEWRSAQ